MADFAEGADDPWRDQWWRRAASLIGPPGAGPRRYARARAGLVAATEAGDSAGVLRLASILTCAGEAPDNYKAGAAKWFELGNTALIRLALLSYLPQLEARPAACAVRTACAAGDAHTARVLLFGATSPIAPNPSMAEYPPAVVNAVREGCTAACQRDHHDATLVAVEWLETNTPEGYAPEAFAACADRSATMHGLMNAYTRAIREGDGPERVRRERVRLARVVEWPMCADK